jgi:hypothetical protein
MTSWVTFAQPDQHLVLSTLVPTLALVVGSRSWWPSTPHRRPAGPEPDRVPDSGPAVPASTPQPPGAENP